MTKTIEPLRKQMNRQDQLAFIQRVAPAAQASQRKWGVPASVTIAQAIIESSNKQGWGKSRLAVEDNNYFGIKDSDRFNQGYVEFKTTEDAPDGTSVVSIARFEKFNSLEDCFCAHGELLARAIRYQNAMVDAGSPAAFAQRLQDCHYSTNPGYAAELLDLMTMYNLGQYDTPSKQLDSSAPAVSGAKAG